MNKPQEASYCHVCKAVCLSSSLVPGWMGGRPTVETRCQACGEVLGRRLADDDEYDCDHV